MMRHVISPIFPAPVGKSVQKRQGIYGYARGSHAISADLFHYHNILNTASLPIILERLGLIGLDRKFQVLERLGRQRAYCRVLLIRGDEGNRHVVVLP